MDQSEIKRTTQSWARPPELMRSTPRSVALAAGGKGMTAGAIILLASAIGMGILFASIARSDADRARLLQTQGEDTDGTIMRVWERRSGKSTQHMVTYTFFARGVLRSLDQDVSRSSWNAATAGEHIRVRYVPSKPDIGYWIGNPLEQMPIWLVLVFPTAMLAIAFFIWLNVRRYRYLLENGRPAAGVVTRCRVFRGKGRPTITANYEYLPSEGGVRKGRANIAAELPVGSVITVLYKPENQSRSMPYPSQMVRL